MTSFAWSVPTLLGAVGTLAVGMGFNGPALSSMVSRLTHADDQGGMLGLASSLGLGARIAQEKHGLSTATVHLSPAVFRSYTLPPAFPGLHLKPWTPNSHAL